jgi:acyl CoA:acetate/3-ketoacid CoA transferase
MACEGLPGNVNVSRLKNLPCFGGVGGFIDIVDVKRSFIWDVNDRAQSGDRERKFENCSEGKLHHP